MLLHKTYQASKSDVFSLGMVIFELLTGMIPWDYPSRSKLIQENRHPNVIFPVQLEISEQAKEIVTLMLESSPGNRPSMETVIQHPWFKIDDVSSLLPKKIKKTVLDTLFGRSTKSSDYLSSA